MMNLVQQLLTYLQVSLNTSKKYELADTFSQMYTDIVLLSILYFVGVHAYMLQANDTGLGRCSDGLEHWWLRW